MTITVYSVYCNVLAQHNTYTVSTVLQAWTDVRHAVCEEKRVQSYQGGAPGGPRGQVRQTSFDMT